MTEVERVELRGLLDGLCEESINPEQMRRLEELVLSNPAAEAYYVQYMSLFADLHRAKLDAVSEPAQPSASALPGRSKRWTRWAVVALTGIAAAILLMVILWPRPNVEWQPAKEGNRERVDDTVAILLQSHDAVWDKSDLPTRSGSPLRPGTLRLRAGVAQVEFYSGATVILQGPAEFKLISRTNAHCAHGKLRATVPSTAHGFTIGSPKFDLVDLGTEFGMQIDAKGKTEIHVFEGKVQLHNTGVGKNASQELTTGQGIRVEEAQPQQPIKSNPAAFITSKELAAQAQQDLERRQKAWAAARELLHDDETLIVHYSFAPEKPWDRTLPDDTEHGHDGSIVGSAWTPGRWPGRQALEFKQVSDRVRFHVPGEFQSLSLMTWVRVDALPNVNNSLMMSDAWFPGGLHWQIGMDGKLILGVQSQPRGKGAHYHAPGAVGPELFGRWLHLAVTYDHKTGLVTHYVNGAQVAQVPVLFEIPLRIRDAELGNWNVATHRNNSPIRFLTGSMDEFMIFSRAVPDADIEKLYEQSRPPS